jgi:hypothetical protein
VRAAVAGLQNQNSNIEFAQIVRRATEFHLLRSQRGMFRIVYVIAGTTPLTALIAGVIATSLFMMISILIGFVSSKWLITEIGSSLPLDRLFDADSMILVAWTILFAAMGSFTSLFVRLSQFAQTTLDDPFLTFCTGFFKPYIGIAFALFALVVMKSNFIKVGSAELSQLTVPAYMALAYVSGFSERFASDVMTRAENRFAIFGSTLPIQDKSNKGTDTKKD